MKSYLDLTKSGIVAFVLLSGFAGFALSLPQASPWDIGRLLMTLSALYFFSAGSFAINQAQEWKIDLAMDRTQSRPIPSGKWTALQAWGIGVSFVSLGVFIGAQINSIVVALGLATVIMYNGLYTLHWKRRWAFGAVPGAIPGAMPVAIGYAANISEFRSLLQPEIVYAFLIMFLWQMPHFWSLAIRFKDDYAKGGIPVLPVASGIQRTLFHMALYTWAYVILAIASPWFTATTWVCAAVVIAIAVKVLHEFYLYYWAGGQERWFPFFMWINFSVLVFLLAPVVDKWVRIYANA